MKKAEIQKEKMVLQKEIADLEAKKIEFARKTGLHLEHLEKQMKVEEKSIKEYAPLKIYEFTSPFEGYSEITVDNIHGNWAHGTELIRDDGTITIDTSNLNEQIMRVSVIGSACTPPGYILLEIPNMGKKLQSVENLMGSHDLNNPSWCRENTAFFEVEPGTYKVILRGGSRNPANNHYAFKIIRVEVEG